MTFLFPPNFLWGTATAAHQVEGNNTNTDYWVMEHTQDSPFLEPSGDACDHYHRYREDIALLASFGFNMYRFSIEWARVEPEQGCFSQAALEHYRRILMTCQEHGLVPMVTLHHNTSPRWLMAEGGWEGKETPHRFRRYASRVVDTLGELIGYICTINEANIPFFLAYENYFPPTKLLRKAEWWRNAAKRMASNPNKMLPLMFASSQQAREVILSAHHQAFEAIKSILPNLPVGLTLSLNDIQSTPGGEEKAEKARDVLNNSWLEETRGDDFIGVQTYTRTRYGADGVIPPEDGVELTQMFYEFWPEALESTIREAINVARIPVIVTENGIGTEDDEWRVKYLERALRGVIRCIQDGLDIRGYTHWSLLDNYEWMLGYQPKFGLLAVDRESQIRIPKPSARWLGNIARKNSL